MNKIQKILIINDIHHIFYDLLSKYNIQLINKFDINYDTLCDIIKNYDGLIIRSKKFVIDKNIINKGTRLKFIARAGSGIDNIDTISAKKKSINIISAAGGNRDAVAEHIIGMILNLTNNICKANNEIKNGIWNRESNRSTELQHKTLGIIGLGNTGSCLAKKIKSLNINVIAYDKYKTNYIGDYVKLVDERYIFEFSDILSINIPLNDTTKNMVDINYINKFKKPIIFINTSRGPIVKTTDLIKAIDSGKIISAGLDVLEIEKFPSLYNTEYFNRLSKMNKIILTPHVAGWSVESYKKISEILADKIIKKYI
ncbi:MAG: phosphoglycerate dehydrogenase [Bacteroides sp.]|nr:MAG: phosphoglycerate dehydrogenase [Bacteroides sp.]